MGGIGKRGLLKESVSKAMESLSPTKRRGNMSTKGREEDHGLCMELTPPATWNGLSSDVVADVVAKANWRLSTKLKSTCHSSGSTSPPKSRMSGGKSVSPAKRGH